ncbi:MAG: hypothetical protein K0R65_2091 [Crocinitomicaceae bacterium]|jgi:hypothetical protein|nr:hypothetical protein [Crocinitomicaceae bacterium]
MKTFVPGLLLLSLLLFSCKSGIDTNKENEASATGEEATAMHQIELDTLQGMYIGDFGGSDIRIVLNFVSPNHAVGYNLHKGLQRNLSGSIEETENEVKMELNEPGDHKFDGTFYLTFSKLDLSCKGYWKSKNKKLGKKNFTLKRVVVPESLLNWDSLLVTDINGENFTEIFSHTSDSIADMYFDNDGSVRYEYYPKLDTLERAEQMVILNGSWTYREGEVIVNWNKKNEVFPDKTKIEIVINPDYEFFLRYKKRRFFANMYGY